MFPNFDQPDLKASWVLKAITPPDWSLVSTENQNKNATNQTKSALVQ